MVVSLAAAQRPAQFKEHLIASGLKGGYQVVVTDMNGDKRPDLIALASGMDELIWFENPSWRRHVIAKGLHRMINVAAWDHDGDGVPLLVLAQEFQNQAKNSIGSVCVLEPKEDRDDPWKVEEIDRIPTSHRLRWADIAGNGKKVLVNAPLTGEYAIPPDYAGYTPLVYYDTETWTRHDITGGESGLPTDQGVVHGIYIIDWDGDGRDDILTASFVGIHLYQFGKDGKWTRKRIAYGNQAPWPKTGSSDIAVGRLPQQRYIAAIEPWHGNLVSVYLEKKGEWVRKIIDDSLVDGHTIVTADVNNDGRDEIIAGFRGQGHSVYIYYPSAGGSQWTRTVLDPGGIAAAACAVSDLDRDTRLDVICIGSATANLKWYENRGPAE